MTEKEYRVIKPEWVYSIRNSTFKTQDDSLFYSYIISPLCNQLLKLIPKWVAPNVITMIGLSCNISLNFLTLYYGGLDNSYDLPTWVFYAVSSLYFAYYLLDNLDGKQARATNSSSELGMIMDHACDALTTFVFTIGMSSTIASKTPYLYFVLWSMTSFPFFFTTLEARYKGVLRLWYINGASEGTIFACGYISLTGYIGQYFWKEMYHITDNIHLSFTEINAHFFAIAGSLTVLPNIISLLHNSIKGGYLLEVLYHCIDFFLIKIASLAVIFYSDSKLIHRFLGFVPFLFGFMFAKLLLHMQISLITKSPIPQFRKAFSISMIMIFGTILENKYNPTPMINIDYVLIGLFFLNFYAYLNYATALAKDLKEILGLHGIFTIKQVEKLE